MILVTSLWSGKLHIYNMKAFPENHKLKIKKHVRYLCKTAGESFVGVWRVTERGAKRLNTEDWH